MPLPEDQIRALQQRIELPEGSVPGTRLTWLGPTDADVDWVSDPDSDIRVGNGDPNGVLLAPKGTLYVDRDAPSLWQNDDGVSSWAERGLTGATGATGPSGLLGILWPGGNTLLSEDTFTTTWGTTNGAGSLDPLTWSTNNGTWTVGSGQAQTSVVFLAPARAWVDLGTGDFDVSLTVATRDSDSGLLFRYSSATDYWSLDCNTSFVRLRKFAGGTPTTIGATHTSADGDVMRVATFGPWIAVLRNGTIQELVFDGHNMTFGNVGLLTGTTSGRFDNFSARIVGAPTADTYVAKSVTGATTVSLVNALVHKLTMTGNITLTLSGATSGEACGLTLYLVQDATGSRTVTWPGSVKWPAATAPTLTTTAGAVDKVELETFDGGTTWYANLVGLAFA